jgi:tetratricopeptide (TPR) repeat protein
MNPTIPLVESVLFQGRNLQQLGVHTLAQRTFEKLARFRNLPRAIKEETFLRLASLHQRQPRRSRRYLAIALMQKPEDARFHFRMGLALLRDSAADPITAGYHLRKAVELNPQHPRYLCALARFALRNDRPKLALKTARRAYFLASDSALVLNTYFQVLRQLHRVGEGNRVLNAARFRLAKQGWFRKLQDDFQFFVLHRRQLIEARKRKDAQPDEMCLLPFPTFRPPLISDESSFVRRDEPVVLAKPHLPARRARPDQRHAQ